VWDLSTGAVINELEGHADIICSVAITPDGRHILSASADRTLKVWDFSTGRLVDTLEGHSDLVHDVAIAPDGRLAVSASRDQTLLVWDLSKLSFDAPSE
jgi:WD40 repeat protein